MSDEERRYTVQEIEDAYVRWRERLCADAADGMPIADSDADRLLDELRLADMRSTPEPRYPLQWLDGCAFLFLPAVGKKWSAVVMPEGKKVLTSRVKRGLAVVSDAPL